MLCDNKLGCLIKRRGLCGSGLDSIRFFASLAPDTAHASDCDIGLL